jgi:phosphoribosylformylglycinamidine (FGAM) synthase-like amidotransferase family enzyme
MSEPRVHVVIPTGFGINCESESAHAFKLAGATAEQVHLNDLIEAPSILARSQILTLAGGFSFGDHLGAGKAFANRLRRRLGENLQSFIKDGGLIIGICNGFQTMTRLGLVPQAQLGQQTVSLAVNQQGRFYDGWVSLSVDPDSPCVFTRGLKSLNIPVRHGEGRLLGPESVLQTIRDNRLAPVRYADPNTGQPSSDFPHNPNGSADNIAGLCDATGRLFGLMPHPEAFLYSENHPQWRRRSTNGEGDGLRIFLNAVEFVRRGS